MKTASGLLPILALLGALFLVPDGASANALKAHENLASEIGSRQRSACTWRGSTRIIHHKRYRRVRTAYSIALDPLPSRFGSFPHPYLYRHRAAMLTLRP